MKKILLLSILSIIQVNAQQYKSAINLEIGGSGLVYNLGYERFLRKSLSLNFGASYIKIEEQQTGKKFNIITFPVSSSHLINIHSNKHFTEAGLGIMNLVTSGDLIEYKKQTDYYMNPFIKLGYRFVSQSNRWQYKLTFTPFYASKSINRPTQQGFSISGGTYQLWGGMSLGYKF